MAGGNQSKQHSALIRLITEYMRARGGYVVKIWGSAFSTPGVPDMLCCLAGRMVAIEAKTGKAVLSATQREQKRLLEASGALYCEVRLLDELEDTLLAAGLIAAPALMRFGEAL